MAWPKNLSEHFPFADLIHSDKAVQNHIDNTPPDYLMGNAIRLVNLAEQFRALLSDHAGKETPYLVHSGYRSVIVNKLVGGSGAKPGEKPSAHMTFRAMDGHPAGLDLEDAFDLMRRSPLPYDKILIERSGTARWIHFQVAEEGRAPRRLAYRAEMKPGGMHYELLEA